MPDIQSMVGKEVEVIANGVSYRGILVEVSDTEVSIKCMMQWVSLPVSAVGAIRIAGWEGKEPVRDGIVSSADDLL